MAREFMLRNAFVIAFIPVTVGQSFAQGTVPLQPILQALDEAKLSGSLELSEGCREHSLPDFPQPQVSTQGGSVVRKLREILDGRGIRVAQDADGMVRMVEVGVAVDLLNVRISHIKFSDSIYTPNDALRIILRAPELISFLSAHSMQLPSGGGGVQGNAGPWPPEQPHISGSLENVSLSQALDDLLKTFPGLWVYWNCPQSGSKSLVRFRFFGLKRVGNNVFVNSD